MHNYHAIETEAAFRQQEWERAAAADARAARAVPANGKKMNWLHLPHVSLAALRSLGSPRLPLAGPLAVGGHAGGTAQFVDCDA